MRGYRVSGSSLIVGLMMLMPSATLAAPVEFVLDNDHTHILWRVDRFGFSATIGTFTDISGRLTFDRTAPANSHVEAVISLASLRSDLPEREDIVRGPYWLNAEMYPSVIFVSTVVDPVENETLDQTCALVSGDMTLKGVTRPLSLSVCINKFGTDPVTKKNAVGFSATGKFRRSEFGVNTALGPIGDEVTFEIEALAIERE